LEANRKLDLGRPQPLGLNSVGGGSTRGSTSSTAAWGAASWNWGRWKESRRRGSILVGPPRPAGRRGKARKLRRWSTRSWPTNSSGMRGLGPGGGPTGECSISRPPQAQLRRSVLVHSDRVGAKYRLLVSRLVNVGMRPTPAGAYWHTAKRITSIPNPGEPLT
jgi:hypothetical protein